MAWQEIFLEHIRKSHYTLLAITLVLGVASTISPSASIEKAYDQARDIVAIEDTVFQGGPLEQVSERLDLKFVVTKDVFYAFSRSSNLSDELTLLMKSTLSDDKDSNFSTGWQWRFLGKAKGNFRYFPARSNMPRLRNRTLASFISVWDFFREAKVLEVGDIDWDNTRAYIDNEEVDFKSIKPFVIEEIDIRAGLRLEKDEKRNFLPQQWYVVVEFRQPKALVNELHIPISAIKNFDIDVQKEIFEPYVDPEYRGTFKQAFGDLAQYSQGLESLELSALVDYLRKQMEQEGRKIEIFGVDIPRSIIGKWGVFLLALSQFYFLLHLNRLRSITLHPEIYENFPWILVYPGWVPKLTAVATVVLLPVITSSFLVWSTWDNQLSAYDHVLMTLGVICNSILCLLTYFALRRKQKVTA